MGEELLEGLFEHVRLEFVGEDDDAAGPLDEVAHFHQTHLIQRARVDVDGVGRLHGTLGQRVVVLCGTIHVLGAVLVDVVVRADRFLQLVGDHHSGTLPTEKKKEK